MIYAEFDEMKKHVNYGRDTIAVAERSPGQGSFLRFEEEIAAMHHEE